MELHSKQFEGSVIASGHEVFFWTRIKLTSIYVLILAIILLGFSMILYQSLGHNLVDASEDNFADIQSHHHFVQNTLSAVGNEIILIDIIILFAAAGVSYILAGYTLRPIQRSVESQKKFSENASHELRTPIAVMKNDVEVLLRNRHATKELVDATLRSNIEEMDRMSKMVKDLLILARSQNPISSDIKKINIVETIDSIVERIRPFADKKSISLLTSSNDPLLIKGSPIGLEQILINLLQNAIEYTPPRGSITLSTIKSGPFAIISVSDTGSGINEKDLPHIFERFYKGDRVAGSGLGLSIVKEIADQHKWKITIESEKEKGTKIDIHMPLV